jgi:branched-subunit amino acid ABC-type transport system permease component
MGLVLVFRANGVLNLSLGGIASVAGFVMASVWMTAHVPLPFAFLIAVAAGAALGGATERVLRPVRDATVVVKAVSSLGLLLVLQAVILFVWGADDRFLTPIVQGGIQSGVLRIGWQPILTAGIALAAALVLTAWIRMTPSGLATLAIAEDRDAAGLLGIDLTRVAITTWMIAGALAAVAGVLLSGVAVLNTTEMTFALVNALAAALLAGFESVPAAAGAAAGVGAVTSIAASIPAIAHVSGLVESLGFIAVIGVIGFTRPRGLVARIGARA